MSAQVLTAFDKIYVIYAPIFSQYSNEISLLITAPVSTAIIMIDHAYA